MKHWLLMLSLGLTPILAHAVNLFAQPAAAPFNLSHLRGKPAVINFWATWCPPCRDELPELAAVQQKTNTAFIGIAVEDNLSFANEYARVHDVTYPVIGGKETAIALMQQLGNPKAAMPFTVLIDHHGEVVWARKGRLPMDELEQRLQALR
jgi:thiol-disulfide isomerase/thioredoxin